MTRRERVILIAVGAVGVLLLWYFYIFAPLRAESQRLNTLLAERRRELTRMQEVAAQITQLEAEFARLQSFIAEIEAKLPAEKEMATLLVQLERLAKAVGIELMAVRPMPLAPPPAAAAAAPPRPGQQAPAPGQQAPPPAAPSYLRLPIGMTIRATFADVLELTGRLTNFPRLIAVRKLAVSPRSAAESEIVPQLSLELELETFVLPRGGP